MHPLSFVVRRQRTLGTVSLRPGSLVSGLNAQQLAQQLRAAYQGVKVDDVYRGREAYEINVKLDTDGENALRDRFRAIFLTSITTIADMLPLLSETSLQAQVLVPLVASVVFGMVSSTLLLLLVLPAAYAIMEDMGLREIDEEEMAFIEPAEV